MAELADTQTILLSSASQRESGSIYPLSDKLTAGARTSKAITGLRSSGFVEERETTVADEVQRTDTDVRYGLYATAAGLAAIGIGEHAASSDADVITVAASPQRSTESATVLTLLSRDTGATLAELIALTGWLPHTTRAALTELRKKGHSIDRGKRGDETCYSIKSAA